MSFFRKKGPGSSPKPPSSPSADPPPAGDGGDPSPPAAAAAAVVAVLVSRHPSSASSGPSSSSAPVRLAVAVRSARPRSGAGDRVVHRLEHYDFLDDRRRFTNLDSLLTRLGRVKAVHVACTEGSEVSFPCLSCTLLGWSGVERIGADWSGSERSGVGPARLRSAPTHPPSPQPSLPFSHSLSPARPKAGALPRPGARPRFPTYSGGSAG